MAFNSQSKMVNAFTLIPPGTKTVGARDGYFRIRYIDMRLGKDFQLTSNSLAALHMHFKGLNDSVIGVMPPPNAPRSDLRRVAVAARIVTPITVYQGDNIDAELALHSVPFRDLAADLLNVLGGVAALIQQPQFAASAAIADVLRQGVNSLIGLDQAKLVLGWQGSLGGGQTLQQKYIVVAAPEAKIDKTQLSIREGRLYHAGSPLDNVDYFVFAVEVSQWRPDWQTLPEIQPLWNQWLDILYDSDPRADEMKRAVSALRKALNKSASITPLQARQIEEKELLPRLRRGDQDSFRSGDSPRSIDRKGPTARDDNDNPDDFTALEGDLSPEDV
jgi:hypothetical protein